jgi:magnesium-transporting ATPase (P-type)
MLITIFEQPKTYRLLQKFEFTSERKKMTVIVQDETNG